MYTFIFSRKGYTMKTYYFPDDYWGIEQDTHVQFLTSHRHEAPVTAATCIALAEDGKIVLAKPVRGYDFPGGHVEEGETPLEALTRELQEEIGADLTEEPVMFGKFLASKIKDTDKNTKYPRQAQVNVYLAKVSLEDNFKPTFESTERLIISVEDAKNYYHRWNRQIEAVLLYAKHKFLI